MTVFQTEKTGRATAGFFCLDARKQRIVTKSSAGKKWFTRVGKNDKISE